MIRQILRLGTNLNVIDKKVLVLYETFDIIKYVKYIIIEKELILLTFTELNVMKLIVLLLLLI